MDDVYQPFVGRLDASQQSDDFRSPSFVIFQEVFGSHLHDRGSIVRKIAISDRDIVFREERDYVYLCDCEYGFRRHSEVTNHCPSHDREHYEMLRSV